MTIALAITTAVSLAVAFCAVVSAHTAAAQAARDRAADRATINMLCQRIQAPQTAAATFVAERAPADPPPVDLDDDEQMQAAREAREQAWQH